MSLKERERDSNRRKTDIALKNQYRFKSESQSLIAVFHLSPLSSICCTLLERKCKVIEAATKQWELFFLNKEDCWALIRKQPNRVRTAKISPCRMIKLWFAEKDALDFAKHGEISSYCLLALYSITGTLQYCTIMYTCAFLADVGQVVVAWHVIPLAILMGNGHHAVLPACKEVIRLVLPPVLIYLHSSKPQDSAFAFHLSLISDWQSPIFSPKEEHSFLFQVSVICKICKRFCTDMGTQF